MVWQDGRTRMRREASARIRFEGWRRGRIAIAFVAVGMPAVMACTSSARADAMENALVAAVAADARHRHATELMLLRPLAEQGNAAAQFFLGVMYAEGQGVSRDFAEAVRWFRKAAEQGHALAQAALGTAYADGSGVPRDDTEPVRRFRKAAEQGDAAAQLALGFAYASGWGVPRDHMEAARWYRILAEQEYADAQSILGTLYANGQGVPKDYVLAYMWFNLAASGGDNQAALDRDDLAHLMTAQQIAGAQQLTAAWQSARGREQKPAVPPASVGKQAPPPGQLGTGFFIAKSGLVLTNAHVVKGCSEARIGPPGRRVTARVIARDGENDLALLRTAAHPSAVAALRLSIRQGEAVAAYGYPLPGLLASGGNLTTGNITALSGIGDDSRLLQISAPVQPGNSGGPLLDGSGNVIGIVEGKLNAVKVADAIGDVPQNVNFAIKAAVVATFLDGNGVHYSTGTQGAVRSPADLAEEAKRFTVQVECNGSVQ